MRWLRRIVKRYRRNKKIKNYVRYLERYYSIDVAGIINVKRLYRAYLYDIRHLKNLSKVKDK